VHEEVSFASLDESYLSLSLNEIASSKGLRLSTSVPCSKEFHKSPVSLIICPISLKRESGIWGTGETTMVIGE
jgi:hypothetical protein